MVSPNTANGAGRGKGGRNGRGETAPDLNLTHNPTTTAFAGYEDVDAETEGTELVKMLVSTDPEQLRTILKDVGFELHTARRRKGAIPRPDKVPGRLRLTGYLPAEMRKDVQYALIEHNLSLSDLVTQAVGLWLETNRFRRPGT